MTIANTIASKLTVAFVAVAMLFWAVGPALAADQTPEELQKTINDLLAQVAALQSEIAGKTPATAVACTTFTRDLKMGATGADVKELQKLLNTDPDTRVAATGAGSAGMETMYFGPATMAAVSKFQVKYRAEILTPAGLVNPTGFFGPSSRAQANKLCNNTPGAGDDDSDDSDDSDDDSSSDDLQGEGSLDTFEIDTADETDLEEGDEDMPIAELTIEAQDGDIQISRMDVMLDATGSEEDPWDTFDTLSIWVDGEMVAEMDASDEDEYLDEDTGEIRFSDLDIVAREDEKLDVTIGATVQDGIDDLPATWNVSVEGVRYFDADGVADDDIDTDEIGDSVSFDVKEAGFDEALKFKLASDNPDAMDIVVDTDSKTNDVTVLSYTIEAEENDIDLNELWVNLETGVEDVGDVVDDVRLVIDGDEFDSESTTTTSTSVDYMFDIDGDVTIDADDSVQVDVVVDLKSTDDGTAYANSGETLKASVTGALVDLTDAEGADDVTDLSGTAVGETHTLVAEGIVIPVDAVETETDTQGDNDQTGIFTISFDVTAVEDDFYIAENATSAAATTDGGVKFTVEGPDVDSANGVLASTADEDTSGVFTVREGETETFTLTVTVDAGVTGNYRVGLSKVYYTTNTNGVTSVATYSPMPAQDFRTDYENINAS